MIKGTRLLPVLAILFIVSLSCNLPGFLPSATLPPPVTGTPSLPTRTPRQQSATVPPQTAAPPTAAPSVTVASKTPADTSTSLPTLTLTGTITSPAATFPCPGKQSAWITTLDVLQAPDVAAPKPRIPFRDAVFGTCVVRVTDPKADLPADDTSKGMVNEYSRVQSFNADGSLILVRSLSANWYLYDAHTLQPLGQVPLGIDPRWDASDPNLIYFSNMGTQLLAYHVDSKSTDVVHDFAVDFPGKSLSAVWTRYEGSPSRDTRYWGLMAQNQDWQTIALLVYDHQTDKVIAERDLPAPMSVDSVTISPLGDYFLAYHDDVCEKGTTGSPEHPCGLMVYDRDLKNGRSMAGNVGHSDLALDAQGREVLVYQDNDTDHISMLDLASGTVTDLQPIDFSHTAQGFHFSGRAFKRPGWVVVSAYNGGNPTSFTWMDNQVFLLELKQGGRVVRLAHHHSIYNQDVEQDYWAEPHASANPDLTRVLFTSNWGRSGTEEVNMYMIVLPPDWDAQIK